MSYDYIKRVYKVPAIAGHRVRVNFKGADCHGKEGVIVRHRGSTCYLYVRLDGEKRNRPYHPTYRIEYLGSKP